MIPACRIAFYSTIGGRCHPLGAMPKLLRRLLPVPAVLDLGLWDKETLLPGAYAEAKCVTLVQEKIGLFPDAPTARGRKHLQELTVLVRKGRQAFVFFFLQHPGGKALGANRETDPEFAELMARARLQGVKFYAYRVAAALKTVTLFKVPVSF